MPNETLQADLRTAQNRMLPFVESAMQTLEQQGEVDHLLNSPEQTSSLYFKVRMQLLSLLCIPEKLHPRWHLGLADSGKRTIEILVDFLCRAQDNANALVNTENYVAFNKFSAAHALESQKQVSFLQPFNLKMGEALTIGSEKELAQARKLIKSNSIQTLWIAWNSTSTGIQEKVEKLVAYRNTCGSDTLIISDAASLPLFSSNWQNIAAENLPDVFFFSLRKQGIPYDGPQDEAHQAKNSGAIFLFNDTARKVAQSIHGKGLHNCCSLEQCVDGKITLGEQRRNHIKHLLKLNIALEDFLKNEGKKLKEQDLQRNMIQRQLQEAFSHGGFLGQQGFSLLASPEAQSQSTYIVKVPQPLSPADAISQLKTKGIQVSVSMHPQVSNQEFLRFACYPGNSPDEMNILMKGFSDCLQP